MTVQKVHKTGNAHMPKKTGDDSLILERSVSTNARRNYLCQAYRHRRLGPEDAKMMLQNIQTEAFKVTSADLYAWTVVYVCYLLIVVCVALMTEKVTVVTLLWEVPL